MVFNATLSNMSITSLGMGLFTFDVVVLTYNLDSNFNP